MIQSITGSQLSRLLAECPSDAYPHGVSDETEGMSVLINGMQIDQNGTYLVSDNVRGRDPMSVDTIDSDWSVTIAD